MFADQTSEGAERIIATTQSALEKGDDSETQGRVHTLKEFSIDHFRPPPKRTLSRTLSRGAFRRKESNELWAYTRVSTRVHMCVWVIDSSHFPQDPIRQPLLKKLTTHSEEIQQKAVSSFLDILAH